MKKSEANSDKDHPLRKLDEAWLRALDVSWVDKSEEELVSELYKDIVSRLESLISIRFGYVRLYLMKGKGVKGNKY